MKSDEKLFTAIAGAVCLFTLMLVFPGPLFALPQQQQQSQGAGGVVQVEAKYVCMINNQRFAKEQIPIEVEGRTYYGCCEMCKEKLSKDAKSRLAVDPVSGKRVDKAKAVIGADAEGKIYYFESAESMKRFKGGN